MNCKRRYADLLKWLELGYSTSWEEKISDLNKISVLTSWKPAFLLKTNSWIGGFCITASATLPLQNFEKQSRKQWLSVKFSCLYWIWFYWTNIYRWCFYTHRHIHWEVFQPSTLKSMTQLGDYLLFYKNIFLPRYYATFSLSKILYSNRTKLLLIVN